MEGFDDAARLLADRKRILVFTGAGISTESGIPDFRGPDGLWKRLDPSEWTLRRYLGDPELRARVWARRFGQERPRHEPNPGHLAVTRLHESGRMVGCITQNVDRLHHAAGLPDDAVAELHGNILGIACIEAGHVADPDAVAARWREGEADPRCQECGSILKSTTVWFGERLPDEAVGRAQAWADAADAVLAVGTTLSVYPAADFPLQVASRDEPFVIVNEGPTDHDALADVKIEGKAGEVLPALVTAVLE